MVSGGRGLVDKSAAGGGSAERCDTTGDRTRRVSGDETSVRVPGVDALEDAQASKVRELELQAVERLVARRVAARDAALNLELLQNLLAALRLAGGLAGLHHRSRIEVRFLLSE